MTDAPGDHGSSTWSGTCSEPQGHWLPISRAVLRFAIARTDRQQSAETRQDDQNPFSIDAFEKFKSRRDNTSADDVDNETNPLSLHNLGRTLRERAGVRQAEIDLDSGYFTFSFDPPTGGSAVVNLAPWYQAPRGDPVKIDPRLELEALFNNGNGLVLISDEKAKQGAQQYETARAAASFVWNQLILPAFYCSVSSGRVKVYARVQSRVAQFQQLPADLLSRLKIENWWDGTACDPEGDHYYSMHAADSLPKVSPEQVEVLSHQGPVLTRTRGKPGRQKGQGSYALVDQPLLFKMKKIITDKRAASPEEAARMVAREAHGSGTEHSKAERLAKSYRKNPPD
jgi:hypothetical protein